MHGMCCHFPNTVRSWSNILNYLKAMEYKVRKDYCVNEKNLKGTGGKEKPKKGKNYFKIKTLCKIIVRLFQYDTASNYI